MPCTCLTLTRQHFQGLLDHSPEVRAALLAQESERSGSPFDPGQTTTPFARKATSGQGIG